MKPSTAVRSVVLLLAALVLTLFFSGHAILNLKLIRRPSYGIRRTEKRLQLNLHAQTANALVQQLTESGWVLSLGRSASERVSLLSQLPPGQPPLLEFRYLDEVSKYGLDRLRLMVDDAGH